MVDIKIKISEKALQLLKELDTKVYAEYRDNRYETLEEFKNSDIHLEHGRTEEWFLSRNHRGTLHLIYELSKYNLVTDDMDAWHPTYIINEVGKEVLEQFK